MTLTKQADVPMARPRNHDEAVAYAMLLGSIGAALIQRDEGLTVLDADAVATIADALFERYKLRVRPVMNDPAKANRVAPERVPSTPIPTPKDDDNANDGNEEANTAK